MSSIGKFRISPPQRALFLSPLLCTCMVWSALPAWAAQPLGAKADGAALPSATGDHPPTPAAALPEYLVKISFLFLNGKRSEDETDRFSRFLDNRHDWHAKVKQVEEGFIPLREECDKDKLYCDVIKIDEEINEGEMTMSVIVYTTPEQHRSKHGLNGKETSLVPCPLKDFDEKHCRETLMKMVLSQIVGMDKTHPFSQASR